MSKSSFIVRNSWKPEKGIQIISLVFPGNKSVLKQNGPGKPHTFYFR